MVQLKTGIQEVDPRHQLDDARLEAFVQAEIDEFEGPLAVRQFVGGQSNPTYHLSGKQRDGSEGQWVLRRKPPGQLLSSAHAVDREFTILSALGKTDFPVPQVRVFCDDESVIGSLFYIMDHVEGRILTDPMLPDMTPAERASTYETQVAILAQLHQIDHVAIGLADYGKPGNFYARQIHRFSKQFRAAEGDPIPAMDRLIEWLPDNVPDDDAVSVSHGDYGLNNMVVHPTEGRIVAILDWELSTIGHPLGDLTYHLSQRRSPSSPFASQSDDELRERGIPTEAEYVARYCELTGRSGIDDLDFYLAFHHFRMASILQGIAARAKSGSNAGAQAAEVGRMAPGLAERALEHARRLGA